MFLACDISSATYCVLRDIMPVLAYLERLTPKLFALRGPVLWRPSAANAGGLKLLRESAYGAERHVIVLRYVCVRTLAVLFLSLRDTSSYYYISV
jgi:hypothetical protein